MAEVDVGTETYTVYADEDDVSAYLSASLQATAWRAASAEEQGMARVTVTRLLNRLRWKGTKTDPDQELAWPRTGTGIEGVEDNVIPLNILYAAYELESEMLAGSTVLVDQNTSQKIASLSAGSVSISYFRGAEGVALRFSLIVEELLWGYLEGSSGLNRPTVTGTDGCSVTNNDFGVNSGV